MKKGLVLILTVVTLVITTVPAAFAADTNQSGANTSAIIIGPDPIDAMYSAKMKNYLLDGGTGYFNPDWDVNKDGVFDALDYATFKRMLLML